MYLPYNRFFIPSTKKHFKDVPTSVPSVPSNTPAIFFNYKHDKCPTRQFVNFSSTNDGQRLWFVTSKKSNKSPITKTIHQGINAH